MQTFSKRNDLKKEYSGYGEASLNLRNRLLQLYGLPYSGDEYNFGIGNDNWIHEVAFSKDLQMHFGKRIHIEDFRNADKTSYDQVFDFIELYYQRALQDLDSIKRLKLFRDICFAFSKSGSVYEFNKDGQVVLKIDDNTAKAITSVDTLLEPYKEARKVYRDCIDGLITRSKAPAAVVGDIYIVFEEYLNKISSQSSFDKAKLYLQNNLKLHSTQLQILEKLKAYRGDVWGAAHAGNSAEPNEPDAIWYLESIITQISYINNKINQKNTS